MLFALLQAFERCDPDLLPPRHRLVLVVLATLADARARVRLDEETVATVVKRTGLGVRGVKRLVEELHAAVWIEREPHQKAKSPPVYFVRLEGGRIVLRKPDSHVPPDEGASGASSGEGAVVLAPDRPGTAAGIPPAGPLTLQELMKRRPGDDLLAVLHRGANEKRPWCVSTAERLLERGGFLTEADRKVLRKIRDESTTGRGPLRRRHAGKSTLQAGNWRPKGAAS